MSALKFAPEHVILADTIHGLPAGRPGHKICQRARMDVCDGCGKRKAVIVYRIANHPMLRHLWLCEKCRRWFFDLDGGIE